ncbi:MAG TPA: hypothetical protein VKE70_27625 [Candidatus Solibacter sp.]|nr:hypothetical protein [Candidatus Solibacter sp.]
MGRRYTQMHADNFTLFHAPVLVALIGLQLQISSRDEYHPFSRVLTILGIVALPVSIYFGGFVGTRAAVACAIIAAAGIARHRKVEAITRWFRWLALASWCLCILAVFATIGAIITQRYFS